MTSWLVILYPLFVGLLFLTILVVNNISATRSRQLRTRLPLDDRIPFVPAFALPYFSAYILGNGGYLFLRHDERFPSMMLGYLVIYIVSNLSHLLVPSRVERHEQLAVRNLSTYLISRFQATSKPFNNFPSMHVSYCLYSALIVVYYLGAPWTPGLLLWAGLVAASTLLTKQHHLIDVGAGALLGMTAFLIVIAVA
jgi:membrane-associated phospholipid phosphatase